MPSFTVSPRLRALIQESALENEEKEKLLAHSEISTANLVAFYRRCKPTESMLDLLKATRMHIPNMNIDPSPPPKSEAFLESMRQLRLRAKEEEYQRLVSPRPIGGTLYEEKFDDEKLTPAQFHKETKSQITTMFNILISVLSVMYAIWYWTDTSWKIRDSYRVLLCVFFGLLILVAEVVVYMGYLNKIEEAKRKERSTPEVKKVIRSYTVR